VIGPAVNLVSRIQALCGCQGRLPLLMSARFAEFLGAPGTAPVGRFKACAVRKCCAGSGPRARGQRLSLLDRTEYCPFSSSAASTRISSLSPGPRRYDETSGLAKSTGRSLPVEEQPAKANRAISATQATQPYGFMLEHLCHFSGAQNVSTTRSAKSVISIVAAARAREDRTAPEPGCSQLYWRPSLAQSSDTRYLNEN
jgi:hypothetical protein